MDKLHRLIEEGQYEFVIEETENSKEVSDLEYRLIAFMNLNEFEKALDLINENKIALFNDDPANLMEIHIFLLTLLNRFDEAYEECNKYKEFDYVSQEIEEKLETLPRIVRIKEKEYYSSAQVKEDGISASLASDNNDIVMEAIHHLGKAETKEFDANLNTVLDIAVNHNSKTIRTMAAFLLLDKKYDKPFKFLDGDDKVIELSLETAPKIMGDGKYAKVLKRIQKDVNDITVIAFAESVLSNYDIENYPYTIEEDENIIFVAIYSFVLDLLGKEDTYNLNDLCLEYDVDLKKVEKVRGLFEFKQTYTP